MKVVRAKNSNRPADQIAARTAAEAIREKLADRAGRGYASGERSTLLHGRRDGRLATKRGAEARRGEERAIRAVAAIQPKPTKRRSSPSRNPSV